MPVPAPYVFDPYFNPTWDSGTPFIVSFWDSFLGERSRMNEAIMQQRLKQMDPTYRQKLQLEYAKQIGELEKAKAHIIRSDIEQRGRVWDAIMRGYGQRRVAEIKANADLNEATQRRIAANEKASKNTARFLEAFKPAYCTTPLA